MKLKNWPKGKFKLIYADPAWTFKVFSDEGKDRSAEKHYKTMTIGEIKAMPVADLADDDCILLIWVTFPNLLEGLEVIKAWGFEYKTCGFSWVKRNKGLDGYFMGLGYWTRANVELCLLATKGKPKRKSKGIKQLIVSRLRKHTQKPEDMYGRIEALADGPYLELFARKERPKWTVWGDESTKFNKKEKSK